MTNCCYEVIQGGDDGCLREKPPLLPGARFVSCPAVSRCYGPFCKFPESMGGVRTLQVRDQLFYNSLHRGFVASKDKFFTLNDSLKTGNASI